MLLNISAFLQWHPLIFILFVYFLCTSLFLVRQKSISLSALSLYRLLCNRVYKYFLVQNNYTLWLSAVTLWSECEFRINLNGSNSVCFGVTEGSNYGLVYVTTISMRDKNGWLPVCFSKVFVQGLFKNE